MKPPVKKGRASVEKQHYWLQIDFDVRADSLSDALDRTAKMFRRAYRQRIRDFGLVYMGAHSATVRGDLKAPRTMHPTVVLKKGLPVRPGTDLATLDAEAAARQAAKEAKKQKAEFKIEATSTISTEGPPAPVPGRYVGTLPVHDDLVVVVEDTPPVPKATRKKLEKWAKKKSGGGVLSGLMLQ